MILRLSAEFFQLRTARIIGRQKLDYDEASMNSAEASSTDIARDAVKRHAWAEALDAFAAADREGDLTAEDLELMGEAAWWAGKPDAAIDQLERAFAAYVEASRPTEAAGVAFHLSYVAFRRQAPSVGAGWLGRAAGLLEGVPESAMHAWLHLFAAIGAVMDHRMSDGLEHTDRAIAVAREHGNADVQYMATSFKGAGEVHQGNMQLGLALLDEAAAAATSGQLDLRIASDILCNTIASCRNIGDLKRAGQWADEGERWMRRQTVGGYPGICRVHRAELKMLRGQWPEAELEARQACEELQLFGLNDGLGFAHHEIGEIRLRMGDLQGAAEELERAYELGDDGQPGIALLHLARGELDDAWRSIERALAVTHSGEDMVDQATRGRLLPAAIDIALARGEMERARGAVEELESIAAGYKRPLFEAGALTAKGQLLMGEDRPSEASPILDRSWRLWMDNDLPYESARARLRYAEAITAEGDTATAHRDLRAARAVFERLGATLDLQRVDALLGEDPAARVAERVTRTFMFTDIVTSTDLVGLVGDEAWGELLSWHNRELRSAFASHRGQEVKTTGDGFLVTFDTAAEAIECAVDIQRRLTRHRREHGFAPSVRIGLHLTEATRDGRDYRGRGVHVAARIGAAASGEEILASADALEHAGPIRFKTSEPRDLTLKGVREPVEVRAVDWR
jgi:class 3 adenylate cyclase